MGNMISSLCNNKSDDKDKDKNNHNSHAQSQAPATKSTPSNYPKKDQANQNNLTSQTGGNDYKLYYDQTDKPTGESQNGLNKQKPQANKGKINTYDFEFKSYLGKGAFGKVALVKEKSTGIFYAMKIVKKSGFALN